MATNPSTLAENAGRITAPDVNYTYGSAKNDSTGTTGDGTPIQKALMNDSYGFQQALLIAAGIVPSGNADTQIASQYLQGVIEQAMGRASMTAEGVGSAADNYVLVPSVNNQAPASVFHGMTVKFIPSAGSTGVNTVFVDAFGFGFGIVLNVDGSDIKANQITAFGINTIQWDAVAGYYVLLDPRAFDSKFAGFGFDGFGKNLGIDVNTYFRNSRSEYSGVIPAVNPNGNRGLLTVEMSTSAVSGGKQTWENIHNGAAGGRFGEIWVRHIDAAGAWETTWDRAPSVRADVTGFTKSFARFIDDTNLLAGVDVLNVDLNIPNAVSTTVGPTGSGADYIWPRLDVVPQHATAIIVSGNITAAALTAGSVATSTLSGSIGSQDALSGQSEQFALVSGWGNTVGGQVKSQINETTIPIDPDGKISLFYLKSGFSIGNSCFLNLKGWLE